MPDFKEQINKIATDLTTLEINTIIKPNILGTKMPHLLHTLMDIARDFDAKLTQLGAKRDENHDDFGRFTSFHQLRERAKLRISDLEKSGRLTAELEADLLMLNRIKDKSDQIKGVFNSLKRRGYKDWDRAYTREQIEEEHPMPPLTHSELVLIRKIWELGTEEIAMQTIIQLDGDVVTRVQPKYLSSNYETIFKVHNEGVSICVSFWKELVGVVKDFFESIGKAFFR